LLGIPLVAIVVPVVADIDIKGMVDIVTVKDTADSRFDAAVAPRDEASAPIMVS